MKGIRYKVFLLTLAAQLGIGISGVATRVMRGTIICQRYRINQRVVYVIGPWFFNPKHDGRPQFSFDFRTVDWSKSNATLAREIGCSYWTVRNMRLKYEAHESETLQH